VSWPALSKLMFGSDQNTLISKQIDTVQTPTSSFPQWLRMIVSFSVCRFGENRPLASQCDLQTSASDSYAT
jgi:hypothetical protein